MKTQLALCLASAMLMTSISPSQSQYASPQPQTPSREMVVIDGRWNPELVPEWLVWQNLFQTIVLREEKVPRATAALGFTQAESELLLKEARALEQRHAECESRLERIAEARATLKPEQLREKVYGLQVECRRSILDARDRIYDAIGPAGAASLQVLHSDTRAGIRSHVPKDELEQFRKPQL